MNRPNYTKTDHMRELDDGLPAATAEARKVMQTQCPPAVKSPGLWLRTNRSAVFEASFEVAKSNRKRLNKN